MNTICRPSDNYTAYLNYAMQTNSPAIRIKTRGFFPWNKKTEVHWNLTAPSKYMLHSTDKEFANSMETMTARYGGQFYGDAYYGFVHDVTKVGAEVIAFWLDTFYRKRLSQDSHENPLTND